MKKLILWVFLALSIGLFAGYSIGHSKGFKLASEINENRRRAVEDELVELTLENNPPPECHASNCPNYDFFDVDGDGLTESVVTEYTTMTQAAGRIWIIDNGRVVFKSKELAQIGAEPRDRTGNQANGFVIFYNTTYQLSPTFLDSFRRDYYTFKDGKFVLENTEKRVHAGSN